MVAENYLHEQLLTLAHDPVSGKCRIDYTHLYYGLSAALVMDLLLAERLKISNKRLHLQTNARTGRPVLNEVLELVQKRKKSPRVTYFLHSLVQKGQRLITMGREQLVRDKVLQETRKKVLWVFKVKRYPAVDPSRSEALVEKVRRLLTMPPQTYSDREVLLISLIMNTYLLRSIEQNKKERKRIRTRIKATLKENPMHRSLRKSVEEAQAVITTVTTTV